MIKDYKREALKIKESLNEKIESLQKNIRDNFVKNELFRSAVDETENEKNDLFIIELANFFGSFLKSVSKSYVVAITKTKPHDELIKDFNSQLRTVIDGFKNQFASELDVFVAEIVEAIEKSDLFTEVVTNPNILVKQARKEITNSDV